MHRRKTRLLVALVLTVLASSTLGVRIEPAGGLAPREPTIAEGIYIVSLDDAMHRKLNFTLRTPSSIPQEYSLQGVILFDMDPLAPEQDKQAFSPIRVGLLYSTHPLETNLTLSQFITKYSTIRVTEGYGSGGNATNPYAGNAGNATYLWGYPALIQQSYVRIFKFDEHTFYQVTAERLTPEQRLTIAKTLITRPDQIQVVVTSTQTITSTSTYATTVITTTTTITETSTKTFTEPSTVTSIETITDPSTYAWALGATTAAVLSAIILLRSKNKSNV